MHRQMTGPALALEAAMLKERQRRAAPAAHNAACACTPCVDRRYAAWQAANPEDVARIRREVAAEGEARAAQMRHDVAVERIRRAGWVRPIMDGHAGESVLD